MSVSRHVEAEHSKLASIKPNLKPKVTRLSSVSERVCVWTVGEQVGIVSVKWREIDGVG